MVGTRKVKDGRETLLALLLGFVIAAYLKAPVELYVTFAACAVGKTGIFNWGNAKEHASQVNK